MAKTKREKPQQVIVPVVTWTRYGRWTPDGYHVLNEQGRVIYTHPLAPRFAHV